MMPNLQSYPQGLITYLIDLAGLDWISLAFFRIDSNKVLDILEFRIL
jgi:hypothetical protein